MWHGVGYVTRMGYVAGSGHVTWGGGMWQQVPQYTLPLNSHCPLDPCESMSIVKKSNTDYG